MTPLAAVLGIVGALLITVGLVGGDFTLSGKFMPHVGMPKVGNWVRLPCFGVGSILVLLAVVLALAYLPSEATQTVAHAKSATGVATPVTSATPAAATTPTAAPVATSASPSPSDTGKVLATGTVYPEEGYTAVYVFSQPSLSSARIGEVTEGTTIGILCTAQGDVVTRPDTGQQSSLWDGTSDGYIPDVYVDTGTNQATMGEC
ncbi:MAG TPA: hypothetical protein VN847_10230 [Streptosporangiaceae bacterium]|nr:hypothetical protein [Streptosporangiaceae bacterium]